MLIGIAASVALLMLPALLWAHARLKKSEPKASAQLATAPLAIALWFTESPELAFSRIALLGPDSTSIALGALARTSDSTFGVVAAIQQPLGPGRYLVDWTTASTDGHPVRGRFSFVILGPPGVHGATSTSSGAAARRITAHIHDTSRVPSSRQASGASASAMDASSPQYLLVR